MIHTNSLELRTITPLFLGGASPEDRAELRVPSIKGHLRFWYRATDPEYRQHETRLFGSSEGGQAGVLLSLDTGRVLVQPRGEQWADAGLGYLGFGPVLYERAARAQVTQRPYLKPGTTFTVRGRYRPWLGDDDRKRVIRAMKAWALFGGLGSRARRGFGSLSVEHLEGEWNGPPADLEELEARCRACLELTKGITDMPEHTAFSSHSVIKLVPIPNNPSDWRQALAWVGKKLAGFRSCRNDGNPRFKPDHDLFYDVINGRDPGRCPERHVFGLPHNYFTPKNGGRKLEVTAERVTGHRPDGSEIIESIERRGSPLFVRVHELADGSLVVLLAFVPSRVLPNDSRLVMKSDTGYEVRHAPSASADWSPITDFLARFDGVPGVRTL